MGFIFFFSRIRSLSTQALQNVAVHQVLGQALRATFSFNLSRNIVAMQVSKALLPVLPPRAQLSTQQIAVLQVEKNCCKK